jgi:SET domain-containing protein
MLLINASKGPSRIHGLGLIAREFIPSGTAVWEFRPGFDVILTEEQVRTLSPMAQQQVRYYCEGSYDPVQAIYILSSDDDRFMNHSDRPNTGVMDHPQRTVAIRDIHPGDEITWDYGPSVNTEVLLCWKSREPDSETL